MSSATTSSATPGDPRVSFFETALSLGIVSALAAALLIDLTGHDVALRLTVLVAIITLVSTVRVSSKRAYAAFADHPTLAPGSTLLIAGLLALANGRDNATLVVVFAWLIAITVPTRSRTATTAATSAVVVSYVLGIVVRGESLKVDGSYGDLIALAAGVAAVVGTRWAVELVERLEASAKARKPAPAPIDHAAEPTARQCHTAEPSLSPADLRVLTADGLSMRQAQVALLVKHGKHRDEIARHLGIKSSTVKAHEATARAHFGVQNRSALAGRVARLLKNAPRPDDSTEH
jgi:DNA-binding CsgD family transcriptional regulator